MPRKKRSRDEDSEDRGRKKRRKNDNDRAKKTRKRRLENEDSSDSGRKKQKKKTNVKTAKTSVPILNFSKNSNAKSAKKTAPAIRRRKKAETPVNSKIKSRKTNDKRNRRQDTGVSTPLSRNTRRRPRRSHRTVDDTIRSTDQNNDSSPLCSSSRILLLFILFCLIFASIQSILGPEPKANAHVAHTGLRKTLLQENQQYNQESMNSLLTNLQETRKVWKNAIYQLILASAGTDSYNNYKESRSRIIELADTFAHAKQAGFRIKVHFDNKIKEFEKTKLKGKLTTHELKKLTDLHGDLQEIQQGFGKFANHVANLFPAANVLYNEMKATRGWDEREMFREFRNGKLPGSDEEILEVFAFAIHGAFVCTELEHYFQQIINNFQGLKSPVYKSLVVEITELLRVRKVVCDFDSICKKTMLTTMNMQSAMEQARNPESAQTFFKAIN